MQQNKASNERLMTGEMQKGEFKLQKEVRSFFKWCLICISVMCIHVYDSIFIVEEIVMNNNTDLAFTSQLSSSTMLETTHLLSFPFFCSLLILIKVPCPFMLIFQLSLYNISVMQIVQSLVWTRELLTGLSLRAGGRGFSLATKRVAPGYFYRKIEEK